MRIIRYSFLVLSICLSAFSIEAQNIPALPALPDFTQHDSGNSLSISRETVAEKPVSVIGPRGTLLGEQNGGYEAWIFPWKIFSNMRITANMQDYPVPIDVLDHSAEIDVKPDHTTITYSHANFTVRQIMLAPKQSPEGTGVLVLYQVEAVRPVTLTFSFDPAMQRMWPAQSDDHPSPEWVHTAGGSGFYILHENFPGNAAALAIPGAEPGILAPYQERAHAWPLQFVLHVDPKRDRNKLFPLLIAFGNSAKSATKEALAQSLATLDSSAESIYRANESYYQKFLAQHTSIETPDKQLDDAFAWAEVAVDQLRVQTIDRKEEALTAGFVGSGDGARPGFGWFFGRDALWTIYAVNSYGDFDTTKREIEFLLHRQSPEGKIMHEWSQTADLVNWKSLPYEYAAADATPLLPMAMNDYLKISGDIDFIRSHWSELEKAWKFETSHDSADGIYNNGQGTGWVESWVPSMPQQEIYLAVLDEQASLAFAHLAHAMGEENLATQATQRAENIRTQIEKEYFLPASDFYAFSHNADGSLDATPSIFPTVAWWDGDYSLDHSDKMFERWASSEFSTDWGTRLLSDRVSFYDPISYHQGSVWPLFTGWASVAEYRAGHPLSGYAHLMQNADLTWAQDLGSTTELLAGQFYQVLGRSTAHQLWSSAMVVSPILRGMFGLEWDAAGHALSITPHLPADWDHATLRRLPIGNGDVDLVFTRRGQELVVEAKGASTAGLRLSSKTVGAKTEGASLHIPLPPVEVAIQQHLPEFGSETRQMKVLDEQYTANSFKLTLAAQASSTQTLLLRENAPGIDVHAQDVKMDPAENNLRKIKVDFPAGNGYVTKTVTFTW
jgi:glycogen debranching enzyme